MTTEYCWWNHSLSEIFVALESNGEVTILCRV